MRAPNLNRVLPRSIAVVVEVETGMRGKALDAWEAWKALNREAWHKKCQKLKT